jgi:hypothetical protein
MIHLQNRLPSICTAPHPSEIPNTNRSYLHQRLHEEQKDNTDELASSHPKSGGTERLPSTSSNANIKHTKQN